MSKDFDFYISKFIIDSAVFFTPDEATIWLAKQIGIGDNPIALACLDHYLKGSGKDFIIDLNKFLTDDRGVAGRLYKEITKNLISKSTFGTVKIEQWHFSSSDWHKALGTVHIEWTASFVSEDKEYLKYNIKLHFKDRYRWHPDDQRITKSVHMVMERQKEKGAKEFWMIGNLEAPLNLKKCDLTGSCVRPPVKGAGKGIKTF